MLIAIDSVRCYNNVMKFYCSKKDLIIGRYAAFISNKYLSVVANLLIYTACCIDTCHSMKKILSCSCFSDLLSQNQVTDLRKIC